MPVGGCDSHVHVIGPQDQYPMAPQRPYTPGPAPLEALRAHLARLGLRRAVIVQPSVYDTDNRCLLDSLDRLEGAGRGIAVCEDNVAPAALRALHARGVRGVRVNLESFGARDVAGARDLLAHWAARVADSGWHVQLYAASQLVEALADELAGLPAPVVLDHFALAAAPPRYTAGAPAGVLPDLLRTGRIHVKLSAPYRLRSPDLAAAWARACLEVAPGAVLWGSDWPHTAREPGRGAHEVSAYRAVDPAELARTLRAWLPTPSLQRLVLVDNPTRLYGF
ncbi:MAG: amidohydrolase family protein [Burkholderiales bacterium]|nr:amidohydrolase family protein [Burkholderiales bacterium]